MDIEKIRNYAINKHAGQKRRQGTPYHEHPIAVANILKEKGFPQEYQIVALLHDVLEDTNTSYEEIKQISNKNIADAVNLLTKENNYIMEEYISRININDMAKMVKLADRLHNLKEAILAPLNFRKRYIEETKKWYIDLSNNTPFQEELKIALDKVITSINE